MQLPTKQYSIKCRTKSISKLDFVVSRKKENQESFSSFLLVNRKKLSSKSAPFFLLFLHSFFSFLICLFSTFRHFSFRYFQFVEILEWWWIHTKGTNNKKGKKCCSITLTIGTTQYWLSSESNRIEVCLGENERGKNSQTN